MKRYLIMNVSIPTEENVKNCPDNAGAVHIHFYGINDYHLFARGCGWYNFDLLNAYQIKEHGYKRECDAKRNWAFNNPQNDEHWRTMSQIVTCEV